MHKIPKISEPIPGEFAPNTRVNIQVIIVEAGSIPALSELMGTDSSARESVLGVFFPLRALVITQNQDGTIAPEATRSTSKYVIAALARFENDGLPEESIIRTLLAKVDPVRQARTNLQYIKDAQRGAFDEFANLYAGDRVDPRKWVAASAMLPLAQLAKSTFQRILKALKAKKKKKRKGGQPESGASAIANSPNPDQPEKPKMANTDEDKSVDSKTTRLGDQRELF